MRHYHDAGLQAVPGYSLTGAALREQCQLLPGAEAAGNWQGENESAWQDALAPTIYATGYEYDALGGALAQTDARGNRQRWSYDVAGMPVQAFLTLAGGSEQTLLGQQSWSAAGQRLEETAGNGVVTTYTYEPQTQRLTGIRTVRADQTVLQDLSYGYDPVGNVLWQDNAAVATRYYAGQAVRARQDYQYDAVYQLISASGRENANAGVQGPGLPDPMPDSSNLVNYTRSYAYDDGGNLLRIQHAGAQSYSNEMAVSHRSNRGLAQDKDVPIDPTQVDGYFDANGNVRQMQPGRPLGWNGRNQLQRVVLVNRGDAVPDSDREVYQYRNGLRMRKQTRRLIDAASQRWDVDEVIYLPGLELRTRFVELAGQAQAPGEVLQVSTATNGGRAQVRVLRWEAGQPAGIPSDQVRYGQGDQVGSLHLELDGTGQVISQEEYYPFGGTAVLAARSEVEVGYKVVRYSGKERDGTGLYYYGYRYYAPWLGRWLNPDPAGLVDGLNVYCMVRNNPVTFLDVGGLVKATPEQKKEITDDVISRVVLKETPERIMRSMRIIYSEKVDANELEAIVNRALKKNQPSQPKPSVGTIAETATGAYGGARPKQPVATSSRLQEHPYKKALDYIWSTNKGSEYIRKGATGSKDILGSKAISEIYERLGDRELSTQKELKRDIKRLSDKPANELSVIFGERVSLGLGPVTNYYRGMRDSDFKQGLKGGEYIHATFMAVTPKEDTAKFFISKEGKEGIIIQVIGQAAGIGNIFGESESVFPPRSVFSVTKGPPGRYVLTQK